MKDIAAEYYTNKDKDKVLVKITSDDDKIVMHLIEIMRDNVSIVNDEDIQNIEWTFINSQGFK